MPAKKFKTLDEQIAILESRGLQIGDIDAAKAFLQRNNYYRISGYSLTLRKQDVFSDNATFQNIIDIYEFDHEMRHILLKYLERIEVTMKSVYAYEFTKTHGATGYLDSDKFTDKDKYDEIMSKANKLKEQQLRSEAYLKHFEKLQQDIPLWAFVDLLTISDISFLYKISQRNLKLAIAETLGFITKGDIVLERFMHHMTILRNLCAHGSRLYNRLFEQKPWLSKAELKLLRVEEDGIVDNSHLYGFILIMRRLLKTDEFSAMKDEIVALTKKYPFVNMRYYGFREDWKDKLV